ncbi:hypothetical protein BOO94_31315 [Pseudomonas sp. FSL W5-0299]|nr:hypothetical protein BOO94_31315 [Pseudomonas sp. FSL W5-0299]
MTVIVVALGRTRLPLLRCGLRCVGLGLSGASVGAALDDLVELASIQPNATAFRTIVDLDALALAHDQIDPAGRTKQPMSLALRTCICDIYHLHLLVFARRS